MATALLESLIASRLAAYFENFDSSQVQLTGGFVNLKDVELRRSAFDELNLPIRLKSGRIGTFHLRVNLSKILFTVRGRARAQTLAPFFNSSRRGACAVHRASR